MSWWTRDLQPQPSTPTWFPTWFQGGWQRQSPLSARLAPGCSSAEEGRSSVTTGETAREHTAAVLKALRQWAPDELADTVGQLPHPLAQLSA